MNFLSMNLKITKFLAKTHKSLVWKNVVSFVSLKGNKKLWKEIQKTLLKISVKLFWTIWKHKKNIDQIRTKYSIASSKWRDWSVRKSITITTWFGKSSQAIFPNSTSKYSYYNMLKHGFKVQKCNTKMSTSKPSIFT